MQAGRPAIPPQILPAATEQTWKPEKYCCEAGCSTERQLSQARAAQNNGTRLDQIAVDLGLISEEQALRAIGEEMGLDYVDLAETPIDDSLLRLFPHRLLHRHSLLPVRRENGTLIVATSDPFDLYPLDELSAATGMSVIPVLASREEIVQADQSPARRRQRDRRRIVGDGRRARPASRRDRDRRLGAVGDGPRGLGRAAGQRDSSWKRSRRAPATFTSSRSQPAW